MKRPRTAELVRDLRERSGASQRELARRAGTSGPTIAAYEAGSKEPRLSTLERLAEASGCRVSTSVHAVDRGEGLRRRRRWRSLALAAATAEVLAEDWELSKALAHENLGRMSSVVRDNRSGSLIDEWRVLIDRGLRAVQHALLDGSQHGDDLRQMQPFAGALTDRERKAVLAAATDLVGRP